MVKTVIRWPVEDKLNDKNAQAAELAAVKAELAEARSGNRYAQLERLAIKRAERAEAGERAAHDAANTAIRQRDEARAALAEAQQALGYTEGTNEVLRGENQRLEAAHAETKRERDEALKALELAREDIMEWVSSFLDADHTKSLEALAAIDTARRALTGGQEDG